MRDAHQLHAILDVVSWFLVQMIAQYAPVMDSPLVNPAMQIPIAKRQVVIAKIIYAVIRLSQMVYQKPAPYRACIKNDVLAIQVLEANPNAPNLENILKICNRNLQVYLVRLVKNAQLTAIVRLSTNVAWAIALMMTQKNILSNRDYK